jgi:lipopolysaccharide/colanic/teichoic acid biosynthesis glycosyltransferase
MYRSQHSSMRVELSLDVFQEALPRPFAPRFAGEPPHYPLAVHPGRSNQPGPATEKPSETKAFHPAVVGPPPPVHCRARTQPPRYRPFDGAGKLLLKRAVDITGAGAALLILAPVLLVLALIVHLDSAGPAIFRQERVGRHGRIFSIVKFRSMVVGAEELHIDQRVTTAGRWMKRYALDELPEFWNVLRGEMSLVGPRPPLACEAAGHERHAHGSLRVRPGITGLWQVNGRSELDWDQTVRLDLYYAENWTLGGDLVILLRTFRAVHHPSVAC